MAVTTTTAPITLLQAVNEMLAAVGTAQITTLDTSAASDPEVSGALQALSDTSVQIQSSGWAFNTDTDFPLAPSAIDGSIAVPNAVASITIGAKSSNRYMTVRQNKLWDLKHFTFNWTTNVGVPAANQIELGDGNLYVDIVYVYVWEDLSQQLRWFILAKAARMWAVGRIPDMATFKFTDTTLADAERDFLQWDEETRRQAPEENPHFLWMRRR